jgi:D-sedoheptulose 7-phosphate isomerase
MEKNHLQQLVERYPALLDIQSNIDAAFVVLNECFLNGGKLLVCGNGGSAADADHIVGELMKGFYLARPLPQELKELMGAMGEGLQGALPAISLNAHGALFSAFVNDVGPENVFAQQVLGYGKKGDVFLGISTSGNSVNVCNGARAAKVLGLTVIGLTGHWGGTLKELADVCILAPTESTAKVQEYHLPIYHTLCAMVEEKFFGS